MSVTKNLNGSWLISDIVNGYLVQRVYYFYSKREAIAAFEAEIGARKALA